MKALLWILAIVLKSNLQDKLGEKLGGGLQGLTERFGK